MRSYCAGSGRVISGGSSTRRSPPSCCSVNRGSARSLVRLRARAAAFSIARRPARRQRCGAAGRGSAGRRHARAAAARRGATGAPGRSARSDATASPHSSSEDPFCRPATWTLATSRRRSHSQAPGVRLVEVVEVEDEVALRGGVEAEVAQVRVAADHRRDAGGRQRGEVRGHDRGRPAEERERARDHPPDPHRDQPVHPALVARRSPTATGSAPRPSAVQSASVVRGACCRSLRPDRVALRRGGVVGCRSDANAAASVEASTVCARPPPASSGACGHERQGPAPGQRSSGRPGVVLGQLARGGLRGARPGAAGRAAARRRSRRPSGAASRSCTRRSGCTARRGPAPGRSSCRPGRSASP